MLKYDLTEEQKYERNPLLRRMGFHQTQTLRWFKTTVAVLTSSPETVDEDTSELATRKEMSVGEDTATAVFWTDKKLVVDPSSRAV
jgi:hypothetical protein